eukprot:Seg4027.1 transcript_id=Seg4027.1/GoldUCD/mRNA.D3Y31 product="hypothetical protein" protein_id=Seg4027.1/GoldUCD/D3Y31
MQPESMQTVRPINVTDGNQEEIEMLEDQTPTLTFEPPPCKMKYSSSKLTIQNLFSSPVQLVTSTPRRLHSAQSTTTSRNATAVEDTNIRGSDNAASLKKTPTKAQETIKRLNTLTPIQEGATSVHVKVVWKSKVQKRELQADLASLGKMLCRGTYEQIANAAWRCKSLRPHLVQQVLKQIIKECDGLCSSKYPSYLRKTDKGQLMNFSFDEFDSEFEQRAPLFRAVLKAGSLRASKGDGDAYWNAAVCMAASVCLKNRSPYMTRVQLMIGLIIQHSGFMAALGRLRVLRLTPSHTYMYKKLDEFGLNHDKRLSDVFDHECKCLEETAESGNSDLEVEPGFKHVIDNFNMRKEVCDMTEEHQNINENWVAHLAVKNRVSAKELSDVAESNIFDMENGTVIPSQLEHKLQKRDYMTLIQRLLTEKLKCFEEVKQCVTIHIPHRYSKEVREKTENIFCGLIYEDENTSGGMQNVIADLHTHVPFYKKDGKAIYSSQGIVGDQLTVERGVNSVMEVVNGFNATERKEGLHFEIADFHAMVKFLQIGFDAFYHPQSSDDKCTLYSDRNLINRRNVVTDVKSRVSACKQFFNISLEAGIVAAALLELGLEDTTAIPSEEKFPYAYMMSTTLEERKKIFDDFVHTLLKKYILKSALIERLIAEAARQQPIGSKKLTRQRPASKDQVAHKDDMFDYQCAVLEYGMLILNFRDAISEGDAKNIGHTAANKKSLARYCKALPVTKHTIENWDKESLFIKRSGKHIRQWYDNDLKKIVAELLKQNALKKTPGRKYRHFAQCPSSLLEGFDLHSMFLWVNQHKKKIYMEKTAR